MLRCIETIRYENNKMPLLIWHQKRFIQTQLSLCGKILFSDLNELVLDAAESISFTKNVKYKCRVLYAESGVNISFEPYKKTVIQKLVFKVADQIDYSFKYENRNSINKLKFGIEENTDILIVKNNLLTDASFTNIALFDGTFWFTPAKPLLEGVQRDFLLENNIIFPKDISVKDLRNFEKIKLFNAMVNWQEAWELSVDKIIF